MIIFHIALPPDTPERHDSSSQNYQAQKIEELSQLLLYHSRNRNHDSTSYLIITSQLLIHYCFMNKV